jgi:uncharacterized protein YceK
VKNTYIKLAIGILLFATWLGLILFKVPDASDMIGCIKLALAGLGIYHMSDRSGPPPAPTSQQAGFASLYMLLALAVGALLLTGCASVQQAVQAYGTVAVTSARAADDTIIDAQKVAFCGLPLSAITRHPDIIPAVRALCLSPADTNGAALLNAVQAGQPAPKS